MKTYFIPANLRFNIDNLMPHIDKLPKSIGLITTIQYLEEAKKVNVILNEKGIKSVLLGQVLGCNIENTLKDDKFEAFFYLGSGMFHPVGLGHENPKEIYTYNPETDIFAVMNREDVVKYEKKMRGLQAKFLMSDSIGVVVSVKEGQMNVHSALHLEEKFPDKDFYIFACNTLDYNELENYPFIEMWVNTMCPRIGTDDHFKVRKGMVNVKDLAEFIPK